MFLKTRTLTIHNSSRGFICDEVSLNAPRQSHYTLALIFLPDVNLEKNTSRFTTDKAPLILFETALLKHAVSTTYSDRVMVLNDTLTTMCYQTCYGKTVFSYMYGLSKQPY